MVQDIYSPEIYLGVFQAKHASSGEKFLATSKYTDHVPLPEHTVVDHDSGVLYERQPLFCISVPAETDWVRNYGCTSEQACASDTAATSKRRLAAPADQDEPMASSDAAPRPPSPNKRLRSEPALSSSVAEQASWAAPAASSASVTGGTNSFPIPGDFGVACVVKLYDGDLDGHIKLNDVVEFAGILDLPDTRNPAAVEEDTMQDETHAVMRTTPALHALASRVLNHYNPAVPTPDSPLRNAAVSEARSCMAQWRPELISSLSSLVLGDTLAAEYLLLHLLSSVYVRREGLALGKLSLNLCRAPHPPSGLPPHLHNSLAALLPRSTALPLTLSNLSSLAMTPRRNAQTMRLQAGFLQLPHGTHVLIDETALSPGNLSQRGLQNMGALKQVLEFGVVSYDWCVYSTDFPADIQVLVVSHGKTLLPVDVVVPLQVADAASAAASAFGSLDEARITLLRRAIALARLVPFSIDDAMSQCIEADFVASRKADPSVTADTLHRWITLARLLSLSLGADCLTASTWAHMRELESRRTARLAS